MRDVWKLAIPPKLKMFLWKMKHEAIPVNARLHARQIIPSAKCTFCDEDESIKHLFFHCPFAKEVWKDAPFASNLDTDQILNVQEGIQFAMQTKPLPPTGINSTHLAAWIIWSIWLARNQKIFQNRIFSGQNTLLKALTSAREWQAAQSNDIRTQPQRTAPQIKNYSDAIICRSDAAWRPGISTAGLAWSFYRANGEIILSHSKPTSFVISSLVAEGLALREAMEHAWALGLTKVIFESDSSQLIAAVEGESNFSDLHGIVSDVISFSNSMELARFIFRSRTNFVLEDGLAKQALDAYLYQSH